MNQCAEKIAKLKNMTVLKKVTVDTKTTHKIIVTESENIEVKIEPNLVLRGALFECQERDLAEQAEKIFEMSLTARVLSLPDLYGGKICAALDRQHPRDLFDVEKLFEHEGLTEKIRKAFVVYLVCHRRSMSDVLAPSEKVITDIFNNQFLGMTVEPVSLDALMATRTKLIRVIRADLTTHEKEFIISIKQGRPKWELMNIPGIDQLPAIQWKLQNIQKMPADVHSQALKKLEKVLAQF